MKVNISEIKNIHGAVLDFAGQQELTITEEKLGFQVINPIHVKGRVTNAATFYIVEIGLNFKYRGQCSRCLSDFEKKGKININVQFSENPLENEAEVVYKFSGDELDITEAIREYIWLEFPIKLLCKTDCQGIGLRHKEDLVEPTNSQFEKLRGLFQEERGVNNGKSNE